VPIFFVEKNKKEISCFYINFNFLMSVILSLDVHKIDVLDSTSYKIFSRLENRTKIRNNQIYSLMEIKKYCTREEVIRTTCREHEQACVNVRQN
jgi:hypothetical protein